MIEMIANLLSGDLPGRAADYEVARRSGGNLVGYMARHMELTIGPSKLELLSSAWIESVAYPEAPRKTIEL
jgi:hypothetical protein